MDFTQDVLWESLYTAAFPVFDTITLHAMMAFGVEPMQPAAVAAIKGATAALIMWVAIGRIFRIGQEKVKVASIGHTISRAPSAMLGWLIPLALLGSFLPVGFAVAFAAGFFRTSLLTAFPAILFAQAGYYYYLIAA